MPPDNSMKASIFSQICLDGVGFRGPQTEVEHLQSGTAVDDDTADRAALEIPYSNSSLRVTALLNADAPHLSPDFVFDDEAFLAGIGADELARRVPALLQWRPHDTTALSAILRQLVAAYRSHQEALLTASPLTPRLLAEYSLLKQQLGEAALEPLLEPHEPTPALAVCVRLPLKVEGLPPPAEDSGRGPALALLQLRTTETSQHVLARLLLSPALRAALPRCRFPSPAASGGASSLAGYAASVTAVLQRQLDALVAAHAARRSLVVTLAAEHAALLLDFEAVRYRRVLLRSGAAVAEMGLEAYPRAAIALNVTIGGGRCRREVALPVRDEEGVRELVSRIVERVEELKNDGQESETMEE